MKNKLAHMPPPPPIQSGQDHYVAVLSGCIPYMNE